MSYIRRITKGGEEFLIIFFNINHVVNHDNNWKSGKSRSKLLKERTYIESLIYELQKKKKKNIF